VSKNKIITSYTPTDSKEPLAIADLYPDLSPEEQAEAEYNLKQYVALIWRIYQRIKRENHKI
jgi:hypothetical protein